MASFRTHICFGIALGVLGMLALASLSASNAPSFLVVVFALATLGSVLPDGDSDTSVPFHVVFGALAIITAVLTFVTVHSSTPDDWKALILWTGGSVLLVWGVLGYLVKRFTRHRGMAHSIPAAFLAGLLTFFVATHYSFSDADAFVLGVAMSAGYLLHLVLDEIYAAVNFHGKAFVPNKAFGSALKLKSDGKLINLVVYGVIIFLLVGNTNRLWSLATSFWHSIT